MWSQFVMKTPSKGKTSAKPNPKAKAKAKSSKKAPAPLRDLADWREQTLERMRALIFAADAEIVEERKWRKPSNPAGVPVFSRGGIVCTGEKYKEAVKLTFANGASLPDPKKLFNSSLEGNMRRAIDIREGESVEPIAFKALVKAAVERNLAAKKK
jgi:hypothetical protein